jgi:hypothetical protein
MSGSFPLLQAARLWQRTRSRGTRYMSGRLGGVKVVIMPNRDFAGMTRPTAIRTSCSSRTVRQRHRRHATAERTPAEKRDPRPRQAPRGGPIDDDPVPFRSEGMAPQHRSEKHQNQWRGMRGIVARLLCHPEILSTGRRFVGQGSTVLAAVFESSRVNPFRRDCNQRGGSQQA